MSVVKWRDCASASDDDLFHRGVGVTITRNYTTVARLLLVWTNVGRKSNEPRTYFFFFFYTHDRIFNNLPCPLTFTRESLQLVRLLPPVFDHSFYFLESLRIATNRSIDRAKFVLPWNLCPAVVRADGASPFHAFRFLFHSIEPRFQVTHLLSISRSSRSVLWVCIT